MGEGLRDAAVLRVGYLENSSIPRRSSVLSPPSAQLLSVGWPATWTSPWALAVSRSSRWKNDFATLFHRRSSNLEQEFLPLSKTEIETPGQINEVSHVPNLTDPNS